ncbi:hypothetical protein IAT38_000126 [Cryptococcus sp. DSM 104549]
MMLLRRSLRPGCLTCRTPSSAPAPLISNHASAFFATTPRIARQDAQAAASTAPAPAGGFPPLPFQHSYTPPPPPPLRGLSKAEDATLKAHFDLPHPVSLATPSTRAGKGTAVASSGLFLYPPLTQPTSLRLLTERTLVAASAIVERISRAPHDPTARELRLVVKNLDRLSDVLCGVIDMCELVRNVHPDKAWVRESEKAYEVLCGYMNELNTSRGLYESLMKALVQCVSHPFPNNPLSTSELKVAQTFLSDFERSGIHLPPSARARFVRHSDSLLTLGRSFLSSASSGPATSPPIEIPDPARLLTGLGSQFVDSLPRNGRGGPALVVPGSWEAHMIARYAREGEARRLVYTGGMRVDKQRVGVLEAMLRERAELADVLGKENWAEVVLADKMAKTPQNVLGFLTSLAQSHRPAAAADVARLQRVKATCLTGNYFDPQNTRTKHLPPLHAWDRDFYSERHMSTLAPNGAPPAITPYFSAGTAILGLSQIFTKLYGISFKPMPVMPGETWHPSVRRVDVVDEVEGTIGVIYCDLFSRSGKQPGAAHYTVRCSRRVDDDDVAGDGLEEGWDAKFGDGLEVEGETLRGKQGKYQLPIVVLSTDVGTVEEGRPALLGWNDLETLFHEMGHAIHSMIGRTEFHNVSGTRCATDFVELPSILMEHFVSSPAVLASFATHYSTNEPLPVALIESHLAMNQSLAALETHGQITMAMLDQKYHALRHIDGPVFDSTAVWHGLQAEIGVVPSVPGTAWQTQFGHLYGYGATYYAYLFDRAIAGKMWSVLFAREGNGGNAAGILSREGGEAFKEKVLKWGGGKDPWVMVGDVVGGLEGEQVAQGDERAMGIVGRWMIQ